MDAPIPMRYQPRNGSGIVDTKTGRFHERDYGAVSILETVRWMNERAAGYPTLAVATEGAAR
jgi:hypothetical protein